jgi:hypothetical protein
MLSLSCNPFRNISLKIRRETLTRRGAAESGNVIQKGGQHVKAGCLLDECTCLHNDILWIDTVLATGCFSPTCGRV